MDGKDHFDFVVLTPAGVPDARLAIAGSRAGAVGVLNLEHSSDLVSATSAYAALRAHGRGRTGLLLSERSVTFLEALKRDGIPFPDIVVLSSGLINLQPNLVASVKQMGARAYVVITNLEAALEAEARGADAVIARGHEAGGWVGDETSFVLLQRLNGRVDIPVWVHGGIGLHTIAAASVGGAAGAVLDSQLLLTRESPLPDDVKSRIATMDGSETIYLGGSLGAGFRTYLRPGLPALEALREELTGQMIASDAGSRAGWRTAVEDRVGWTSVSDQVLAIGQDACFASSLADRFVTVGGVIGALKDALRNHLDGAVRHNVLAEGSALAQSHGTRFPIVQGPMTRVSDRAAFADSVATAGALPFVALALMRGPEVEELLTETAERLAGRPWGVGILGFVPPELRAEQLAVIHAKRPPFVLIAGGRSDQARSLEDEGITTYLHVPSPGLLKMYLQDGARRFIFEGRECGGHVGPRTSFVLWESMIDVLLNDLPKGVDPSSVHVLFAGGIHDGLSAAMVSAMGAPLAAKGMKVGALIGSAYLFTEEAVASGAITSGFQQAAIDCDRTVLLESGPGHATRCVPSPFADDFETEKRELLQQSLSADEIRNRLEELNIGRLRIASKGVDRNPSFADDAAQPKLISVSDDQQWSRGMYMIGQVAALRSTTCTMEELHRQICDGSAEILKPDFELITVDDPEKRAPSDIAIVGIGCIVPGAPDMKTFWANILNKVDAITEIPAKRWDWRQYYDPDRNARDKIYSKWGGFIDDVPFDPIEFGMPPSSLKSIEPFQLLALLVVRAALEDAGLMKRPFPRERTSVMLGAGGGGGDLSGNYVVRSSLPSLFGESAEPLTDALGETLPEWTEDSFAGILMNVAAGRVANRFDFGGLNYTVDAACASSLAAIYLAVRDLESGNSDVAIAGGIDAIENPFAFLCFAKTQALSPTGHCRPFDAEADGIAISEGFATVVMKRLADAERDGDRIYAVIRGVGGASDGRDRSLTAPRPEGQMRALRRAYAQAGYAPSSVGLIEAHGTGTVAGDKAEIEALSRFFAEYGAERQGTAVGSVKSMIGHTKAAAGVAGLIKVALALHHGVLPPTLGVTQPNPKANFAETPLYVNTEARPWPRHPAGHPRRAGVSAFGFGGTDFHITLEEYTGDFLSEPRVTVDTWPAEIFVWKSDARSRIVSEVKSLLGQLEAGARPPLHDLAYSVALNSGIGPVTLAIVSDSIEDLIIKLRGIPELLASEGDHHHLPSGIHFSDNPLAQHGKVAFLFPGQGSQYVEMCRDLAVMFPDVRDCFERADATLAARFNQPLSRFVFPPPIFTPEEGKARQAELTETNVAQPALGAAEVAILRLLRRFGVEPQMAAGHSYGEFVALHAAGSFDEQTLYILSEARGRFMREGATDDAGTMAAIEAGVEDLAPLVKEFGVTLANLNAPLQTVISGSQDAVDKAVTWCTEHGFRARRLPVACAFHSPLVAPAKDRLAELLANTTIQRPDFPVYSNTTGNAYLDDPSTIAATLSEHLVSPVHWRDEIVNMYGAGARVFVEAGPKSVLSGLVGQILDDRPHVRVIVDQPRRHGVTQLLHGLATLAAEGVDLRLSEVFSGRTVKKLDLKRLIELGKESEPRATTWFVNGGRAIPATKLAQEEAPRTVAVRLAGEPDTGTPAGKPEMQSANGKAPGLHPTDSAGAHSNGWEKGATGLVPAGLLKGNGGEPAMSSTRDMPFEVTLGGDDATARGPGDGTVEGSEDVMAMFQHVMQRFLDTQRSVMLAYLGGGQAPQPRPANRALPVTRPRPVTSTNGKNGHSVTDHGGVNHEPVPQARVIANGHATNGNGHAVVSNGHDHTPVPASEQDVKMAHTVTPVDVAAKPAPVVEQVAAPVVETPAVEIPSRDVLLEMLLQVVSDRTGYPSDMLGLDADLEADLGIDSIKRVEISGTIVQSLTLPPDVTPDLERLTSSRTLNQVVDALVDLVSSGSTPVAVEEGTRPFDFAPDGESIGRFLVAMVDAPETNSNGLLARDGVVVIAGDALEAGDRIARALTDRGYHTVRLVRETPPSGDEGFLIAALDDPAHVEQACDQIRARFGRANALIFLSALFEEGVSDGWDVDDWTTHRRRTLDSLLMLAQQLREDLENSSLDGGAAVLVGTSLGGAYGSVSPSRASSLPDGALSGFVKTLAQEWPSVRARAIDFDATDPIFQADHLLAELFTDDNLAEVAYVGGKRVRLAIRPANFPDAGLDPLDANSVVLITGGARGITAEVAATLAERYASTFVLVGRTPAPEGPEPAFAAGLTDRTELRKAVIEHFRSKGMQPALKDVEREVGRILGEREVRESLNRIGAAAKRVKYISCDVRDAREFGTVIDSIYAEFGRIDGVIHGAGIIEDKLIKDKPLDSFDRVISTKVDPALMLASRLRLDSLKFLVFFSSVSGRFGNRGQGDYAAANEMLNKLAVSLDASSPARVVSINWGPWLKTGMVSPEVQRQFAERQVTLIPIEVGCRMLDQEIRCGKKGEAEVVIGGTGNPEAMAAISRPNRAQAGRNGAAAPLSLLSVNQQVISSTSSDIELSRTFDVAVDRYLDHHRLDGRPVLPFAFASELMAETAQIAFDKLHVAEVRDIRLMNGLTFDQDAKPVHVKAHLDDASNGTTNECRTAVVTISAPGTPGRMHYRSNVLLTPGVAPLMLDEQLAPLSEAGEFPMPVEQAYRDWLFHGPVFQRIVSIERIGPSGASAWLLPSRPSEALDTAADAHWIIDPVLVDGAFQMQVIWARLHWDVTLLPAEVGAIYRFDTLNPADGPLRYELRIRKESSAPLCHADHFFFDRTGRLVGRLRDVVGAGSRELNRLAGSAR